MLRDQLRELVETSPELKAAVAKLARRVEASDPHVSCTALRCIQYRVDVVRFTPILE